ncbi:NAD(P)-dependent oxidoreductase [Jiangella asiatica]|uniref:NAD(P)-dependent oxidoreductase n=1 Tax=Jiangella asiatica TaxID=2530372 RepID=A0A4R5D6H5_9ACTN|nr:NAD(P)-dependent oxidoreductase [Jiangella asiatica]TDE07440.1 NAD(P)-dependent oxidoreductase [Jiangella asiatica]
MNSAVVGLIGAGEAGRAFGGGLVAEAGVGVLAYDAAFDADVDAAAGGRARDAARAAGLEPVTGPAEIARGTDVVFSFVTAASAEAVARSLAPHLTSRHVVADANSASPALMERIAGIVEATGAAFADVAVMAAVPPHRHRVPLLASGAGADPLMSWGAGLGLDIARIDGPAGAASSVKMLRSLLVKGVEALVLQTGLAAAKYGVLDRVLDSMGDLPFHDWRVLADYLIGRTAVHGERRGHELLEVAATLRALDVDAGLAEAGARALLAAGREERLRAAATTDPAPDRHTMLAALTAPRSPHDLTKE